MKADLISTVIPVYSSEDTISQCLISVLSQSYTHLDIIIVGDGSTDSSKTVIYELIEKDARIRYFYQ